MLVAALLLVAAQTSGSPLQGRAVPGDPEELRDDPAEKASSAQTADENDADENDADEDDDDDKKSAVAAAPEDVATPEELRDMATLQALEGRLSLNEQLSAADVDTLLRILAKSPAPRARALAAAVLPWLDPSVSAPPLFTASRDPDARVRATAGQSLIAVSRRLPEELKKNAVNVAISLLDDPVDEAACAGADLLAALAPPGLQDAFQARAKGASDVRYACFASVGGLPLRAITMPDLPPDPDQPKTATTPGTPTTLPETPTTTTPNWMFLAAGAGTGLLVGGALPGAFVPSRDVLLYDDATSKLSREEVSFLTTGAAAIAGAAALGGAAYGIEALLGPLSPTESTSVLGGAGAGTVLGAGLGLMIGAQGGGQAMALSLGSLGGFAGGTGLAYGTELTDNDNALMASAMAMGGLASALTAFTAVPVGLTEVLGAQRSDFGLGAGMTGAGLFGLAALGAGAVVEVPAARSAAVVAGGLLGGGLLTGLGFLIVPTELDTSSRVACGLGLSGQVIGMTLAYLLVPDEWLALSQGAVVDVAGHRAELHLPMPVAYAPLPGSSAVPMGVALLHGRF